MEGKSGRGEKEGEEEEGGGEMEGRWRRKKEGEEEEEGKRERRRRELKAATVECPSDHWWLSQYLTGHLLSAINTCAC